MFLQTLLFVSKTFANSDALSALLTKLHSFLSTFKAAMKQRVRFFLFASSLHSSLFSSFRIVCL